MGFAKPFHRNYRGMKLAPNSGYSSWAYIPDPEYAKNAPHYIRAFKLIQNDLHSLFEYIEPSDECNATYSYRIHALFMRTCIEIEANFKAILYENTFTLTQRPSMKDYRRIDVTQHLSSYEIMLPIWNGVPPVLRPFEVWRANRGQSDAYIALPWYQAYNSSKHGRQDEFKSANFENLVMAVAGLLVLISSQFRDQDFDVGPRSMVFDEIDSYKMISSIGSLFRIKYPDDWTEEEEYNFRVDLSLKRDRPF